MVSLLPPAPTETSMVRVFFGLLSSSFFMCGKAFLVPSGCNLSSFSLQLHFRLTVTVVFKIRNHSPVGLESDSLQAASCVLSFSLLRSAVPVSGFCFFPLFRVFLGKKGEKWWHHPFLPHKKECCHHPTECPAHSGFSGLGGSGGSTFENSVVCVA